MALLMKSVVSQYSNWLHFPSTLDEYNAKLEAAFAEAAARGAMFGESNMTLSQVYHRQPDYNMHNSLLHRHKLILIIVIYTSLALYQQVVSR